MPGGSNPSNRLLSQSADQQKQVKTVQSLLTAKKDKDKNKQPPKRTRSDVSTDSNTSMDLSRIINFQKDLDEIKFSLRDVTTKDDLNEVTKDLVKTADLENMKCKKRLSIENEHLRRKIDQNETKTLSIRKELSETTEIAKVTNISSNYNEQYSRKNNIKVYNFPWKRQQDLRQEFIQMVKSDLIITLHDRDIVAIHRLPAQREPRPLIVRCFNTDVKRSIMRKRKELRKKVKFVDDVTTRNMALIKRG
ncbi:unnamed protein product [Mytilus coruscus]|uniref:Uncharacterized protein n=1 Tax=Mytilus coruscus TaxID=42192 RepID=A0A6J8B7P6_MYTCO|nr:unnamed protein product [Mytilus coruscus]